MSNDALGWAATAGGCIHDESPRLAVLALGLAGGSWAAGGAPLADAAEEEGNAALVRTLLHTGGADVDAAQVDGMTARHWAAYHDDAETAELLVRAGADVDAVNRYGVPRLSLAAHQRQPRPRERAPRRRGQPRRGASRRSAPADTNTMSTTRHEGRFHAITRLTGGETNREPRFMISGPASPRSERVIGFRRNG
ncbi:MAG: ankyrin repeat domain-containing protein [Rhodospirillales bacterium]|nr:ankyrin repeat domain-containing protein [Rhodospirillales bacterium]